MREPIEKAQESANLCQVVCSADSRCAGCFEGVGLCRLWTCSPPASKGCADSRVGDCGVACPCAIAL